MSVIWKINGNVAATLGVKVMGGEFGTFRSSTLRLDTVGDFDSAALFAHGAAVAVTRTEGASTVTVFQGKVKSLRRYGRNADEGHGYLVEDAWADLETTVYQEPWQIGSGTEFFPRAILGMSATTGDEQTVGEQVAAIVTYAKSVGVAIEMGTTPGGEILWPQEIENMTCAEAIRQCLEFHPDWFPWLDHSTVPPTLHVTKVSDMPLLTLDVSGDGDIVEFSETRRDDLMPDAVRIIFEFATTIDDEVYRNAVLQQWPAGGTMVGPRWICTTLPLAGEQMQNQKSRIRSRRMPDDGETSARTKGWLKKVYPHLADVPHEEFEVVSFSKKLWDDGDEHPREINERAPRLVPTAASQIDFQLLDGQVEDWMRKKVGWVAWETKISPAAGASAATLAAIAKGFPGGRCVATNAESKLHKGRTQWAAPEAVPEGVARGIYESLHAAYQFQGSVTHAPDDVPAYQQHGRRLTLAGGMTTGAPVHSVQWDAEGISTLSFGPVPELSPANFVEAQRRARGRKVTWWSKEERISNKLGAEESPSAAGDTVGGYNTPQTTMAPGDPAPPVAWGQQSVVANGAKYDVTLSPGFVRELVPKAGEDADAVVYHTPETAGGAKLSDTPQPKFSMSPGEFIYLSYATDKAGKITGKVTFQISSEVLKSTHYQPTDGDGSEGVDGAYKVAIGRLVASSGSGVWVPRTHGYIDHVAALWTGKNLGDGAAVYKKRDAESDEFQFRKIHTRFGLAHEEDDDQIELDIEAENIGGGVEIFKARPEGAPGPPADEPIKFRTIRALSSEEASEEEITPQIRVELAAGEESAEGANDSVRVRGNGRKGSRSGITWSDGLITIDGDDEDTGGADGDIVFELCGGRGVESDPLDPNTWDTMSMRLTIRGGKIVGINAPTAAIPFDKPLTVLHYQDCCFIDDPSNDDWRTA